MISGEWQVDDRGEWIRRRPETVIDGTNSWKRSPEMLILFVSVAVVSAGVGIAMMASNDLAHGLNTRAKIGIGLIFVALLALAGMTSHTAKPAERRKAIDRAVAEGMCPNCLYSIAEAPTESDGASCVQSVAGRGIGRPPALLIGARVDAAPGLWRRLVTSSGRH